MKNGNQMGKIKEALMELDGVAAANVDEPSAGDLERVLFHNQQLRDRIKNLELELDEYRNAVGWALNQETHLNMRNCLLKVWNK